MISSHVKLLCHRLYLRLAIKCKVQNHKLKLCSRNVRVNDPCSLFRGQSAQSNRMHARYKLVKDLCQCFPALVLRDTLSCMFWVCPCFGPSWFPLTAFTAVTWIRCIKEGKHAGQGWEPLIYVVHSDQVLHCYLFAAFDPLCFQWLCIAECLPRSPGEMCEELRWSVNLWPSVVCNLCGIIGQGLNRKIWWLPLVLFWFKGNTRAKLITQLV